MRGRNKVTILGTLGRDPEPRYFNDNGESTSFTVATSEVYNDKATGETIEDTEWHRIVGTGNIARIANNHLKKGSKVYIEGVLKTRKWFDQSINQDRYITEIHLRVLEMVDTPPRDKQQNHTNSQDQGYQNNRNQSYHNNRQRYQDDYQSNSNQSQSYQNNRNQGYQNNNQNNRGQNNQNWNQGNSNQRNQRNR